MEKCRGGPYRLKLGTEIENFKLDLAEVVENGEVIQ
jgi:hypothetical protein